VKTRPQTVVQLNDKTAAKTEKNAFMGVMEFSERNALTSEAEAELGTSVMNTQVVVSFNNSRHHRTHRLGGQSKRDITNADEPPQPTNSIGTFMGVEGWDKLVVELARSALSRPLVVTSLRMQTSSLLLAIQT